eukprot:scaffold68796_cov32-Tisochrysis_lutea.AAC.6
MFRNCGIEMRMVVIIALSCFAVRRMRKIRTTRKSRSTRSSAGGNGTTVLDAVVRATSEEMMSNTDTATRMQSKMFHASAKYRFSPRPAHLRSISPM